ncbi:MAG: hypothetical protein KC583_04785, partial [Myxococcales bacterium]|nr:hypothetical protein [Myxococcales bacterium]
GAHVAEQCIAERCAEPPPPPVTCEDRCAAVGRAVGQECLELHGDENAEACRERVRVATAQCIEQNCAPAPSCEDICFERRAGFIDRCVEAGGEPRRCAAEIEPTHLRCLAACNDGDR